MKNVSYTLILFCIMLLSNCKQAPDSKDASETSSISGKSQPSVEVVNPSIQTFNSTQVITGNIRADQSVKVHAMEKGIVKSIIVDIGDKVKRGQVIARLSNPLINIELKEAEVKLLEERANLTATKADLKMNETAQETAQTLYDRISTTFNKSSGLTTIVELENAKQNVEMAKAHVEISQAQVKKCNAKIQSAELKIKGVQERVNMLNIYAPFSGVITGRYVDKGAMIQNALSDNDASPLLSISSIDPVRLILPIPESDISGIKNGDEVEIEFPSLAQANIKAPISRISRNLDSKSKTMEVQIDIPNKNGTIKTGMYAKAKIRRSSSTESLSLPNASIQMKKDASFILVVKDGIVHEVKLKKGLAGKDFFQVLNSEINANSKVIVKGKSMVKSGQAVQAILK